MRLLIGKSFIFAVLLGVPAGASDSEDRAQPADPAQLSCVEILRLGGEAFTAGRAMPPIESGQESATAVPEAQEEPGEEAETQAEPCVQEPEALAELRTLFAQATGIQAERPPNEDLFLFKEKIRLVSSGLRLEPDDEKAAMARYLSSARGGKGSAVRRPLTEQQTAALLALDVEAAQGLLESETIPEEQRSKLKRDLDLKFDRINSIWGDKNAATLLAGGGSLPAALGPAYGGMERLPGSVIVPGVDPGSLPSRRIAEVPGPGQRPRDVTTEIPSGLYEVVNVNIRPIKMPKEDYERLQTALADRRKKVKKEQLNGESFTGWWGNAKSTLNNVNNKVGGLLGLKDDRPTAGCSFFAAEVGEKAVTGDPHLRERYNVGSIAGIRSPVGAVMKWPPSAPLTMPHFVTVVWPKGERFDPDKALYCDTWTSDIKCGPLQDFVFEYPMGINPTKPPTLEYSGGSIPVSPDATWTAWSR